jgi:hypothetical protein
MGMVSSGFALPICGMKLSKEMVKLSFDLLRLMRSSGIGVIE